MTTAVLLPGFGGSADQPILKKLEAAVDHGITTLRLAPPRMKLTADLAAYVSWLAAAVPSSGELIIVGRSFGGRLAVRLAERLSLKAIVLLGFPIRPPGKPRPLDEAALLALRCPTLIIQGTRDELGPMKVLAPIVKKNRNLTLHALDGAGHAFGAHERAAIAVTAQWLLIQAAA